MKPIYIEFNGETRTMREWGDLYNIPKKRIKGRWDKGMRDPIKLFAKNKLKADSKWIHSEGGNQPICSIHKTLAVWHENKSHTPEKRYLRKGQWSCLKCDAIKTKKIRQKQRNTFQYQLRVSLWAARSRDECELTIEYIREMWNRQNGLCAITRLPMEKFPGDNRHNRFKFSIDRIDNDKPYFKSNVWLVCEFVNRAKSDLSNQELISFARGILENFSDGNIVS